MGAKQRGSLHKPSEAGCTLDVSRVGEMTLLETSNKGRDDELRMCYHPHTDLWGRFCRLRHEQSRPAWGWVTTRGRRPVADTHETSLLPLAWPDLAVRLHGFAG